MSYLSAYFTAKSAARLFAVVVGLCNSGLAASGNFAIILNKANTSVIDKATVARIYLGEKTTWDDGTLIMAVDLPENSATRSSFSREELDKSVSAVMALRARFALLHTGSPPKRAASEQEVKQLVAANKGAIGYLKISRVDGSVRLAAIVMGSDPDIQVICSAGVSISANDVRAVFLGERLYAAGVKLLPSDNRGLQPAFLDRVLKMDAQAYTRRWIWKSFRDGSTQPEMRESDADVLVYVKRTRGACGYISRLPPAGVSIAATF